MSEPVQCWVVHRALQLYTGPNTRIQSYFAAPQLHSIEQIVLRVTRVTPAPRRWESSKDTTSDNTGTEGLSRLAAAANVNCVAGMHSLALV